MKPARYEVVRTIKEALGGLSYEFQKRQTQNRQAEKEKERQTQDFYHVPERSLLRIRGCSVGQEQLQYAAGKTSHQALCTEFSDLTDSVIIYLSSIQGVL